MPARVDDEWSDSDEEYGSSGDVETNVQLGIPDGSITTNEDLKDPRVSRIGGHPVRSVHFCLRTSFSVAYILRWCLGFPCILSPRCIRFAMQNLFEPHATCLPDLVSNRRQSSGPRDVYLGLRKRKVPEEGWKVDELVTYSTNWRLTLTEPFYSVRAWRCVRFNKKYAEKLERKAVRKEREKKTERPAQPTGPKSNPFSVSICPKLMGVC